MKFQGQAVLVYLEEDNITKAYFRIRPLLTEAGPVSQEELNAFPDEGYLRIVPDKNEQHTFKERMRSMCGLCLLDLRNLPAEANKIRTNKNYNPSKGEMNRFIVYSDAVQAICPGLLYQVVSETDGEKAVTPQVYVRNGANMQGPVEKGAPAVDSAQLAPDSNGLYSISVNGQELLFYWPPQEKPVAVEAEEKPAEKNEQETALDKIQQMNASCVQETANRLQEEKPVPVFVPQPQQPLSGTRLYQPPQKQASFRRAHNPLMETVEQQRYAAKYEAPGAVVSAGAPLKDVQNPVDAFKRCLSQVCQNDESCRQAVDALLSCPGMKVAVTHAMSEARKELSFTAAHNQLQELEAERLMLLMQLDDAKKDMAALRQEAIGELTAQEKAAQDKLSAISGQLKAEIAGEEAALDALNNARMEAQETLEKAAMWNGQASLLKKTAPSVPTSEMVQRMETALKAAGFICEPGDALAMLTAYAINQDAVLFTCANTADAILAAQALACVFDAPISTLLNENIRLAPGGNTPALRRGKLTGGCTAFVSYQDLCAGNAASFTDAACAMFTLHQDLHAVPAALPAYNAASVSGLSALLSQSKLSADTIAAVNSLRNVKEGNPLPLKNIQCTLRFIAATQNTFKGGAAESIDRAVSIFILPYYLCCGVNKDCLMPLLAGMPRSALIWNELK